MVAEDLLAYKNSTKSDVKFKEVLAARNVAQHHHGIIGMHDGAGIDTQQQMQRIRV